MDDDTPGSDPCFAHHLVDGHVIDPETARDVATFRKAERTRLYALRKAMPVEDQRAMAGQIAARLDALQPDPAGTTIAAYWPIRGEIDLRGWLASAHRRGARLALPVIVQKHAPVAFHHWQPGAAMTRGVWNIPVPAKAQPVTPDTVIVPLLGVDEAGYRLGNGGGYYDRTLARARADTAIIGVGQPFAAMRTIYPMPWDIPMQRVILGDGTVRAYP